MSRIPNLFLIGAKKSATSSLWEYIRTHPQIYSSEMKEPRFFFDSLSCKDLDEYLGLFESAGAQTYLLDASPQYTFDSSSVVCAERIFKFNPLARIVYLLRDPFDRMLSDYLFSVWRSKETRGALEALSQESIYLQTSFYAARLKPYWERFGKDAIYIDTFENLIANPASFCKRLFEWLLIDADFTPGNLNQHLMRTPKNVNLLREDAWPVRIWRVIRRHPNFTSLFPRNLRKWSRSLLEVREVIDAGSPEFTSVKEELRRRWAVPIQESILQLEEVTGRRFDEWPSRSPLDQAWLAQLHESQAKGLQAPPQGTPLELLGD